jgi:hypothetical protein
VAKPRRRPADLAETLDRAFLAACGDLKPKGKLPAGMDDARAMRAIAAKLVLELVRLREYLEEEDEGDPDWAQGTDGELGLEGAGEPGGPAVPGGLPTGTMLPHQVEQLMAQQDEHFGQRILEERDADPTADAGELVKRARAPRLVKADDVASSES